MVGRGFASRPGDTKDHHKIGTNCLPEWHAKRQGRSLTVQPDCQKGRVVCGTVYGDMHSTVTSHFSDSPLFRRPIVPTAHYSDQLLSYKVYNIFTSVHEITLKTVSLVERWNPQSDKLAHFLSDRNTAPSLA